MAAKGYELYLRLVLDDKITSKLNNVLSLFTRINTQAKTLDKTLRGITNEFSRAAQAASRFEKSTRNISNGRLGTTSGGASNFVSGAALARIRGEIRSQNEAEKFAYRSVLMDKQFKQKQSLQEGRSGEGSWNSLHKGMMGFYVGEQILGGVAETLKPGMEFINLQNQMIARGEKLVDIQKAQAAFSKVSKDNLNISVVDAAKMYVDLRTAFASSSQALAFLPEAARLRTVMRGTNKEGDPEAAILGTIRSAEIYGRSRSPELTQRFAENIAKVMIATGGRVTGTQYQQVGKKLAGSGANVSDEFLFGPFSYLIQEAVSAKGGVGNAGGAATWWNQFMRQFALGIGTGTHKKIMKEMGLMTSSGQIPQQFASEAISNEFEFTINRIKPAIERYIKRHGTKGTKLKDGTIISPEEFVMAQLASTQGSLSALNQYILKEEVIKRHSGLVSRSDVNVAIEQLKKKDPQMAMEMIVAQWTNAKLWAGLGTIQALTGPMYKFAEGMNKITSVLAAHPAVGNEILKIAAGFGALLAAGGFFRLSAYLLGLATPFGRFIALVATLYEIVNKVTLPNMVKGAADKSSLSIKDIPTNPLTLINPLSVLDPKNATTFGKVLRKGVDIFSGNSTVPEKSSTKAPVQIKGDLVVDGKAISKYTISGMVDKMHPGILNMGSSFDASATPSHFQTTPSK